MSRHGLIWSAWVLGVVASCAYLGYRLTSQPAQALFLIGATSHGHHQIELACSACHARPFGGGEVLQEACVGCHAEELELAEDSHPRSKFTDPRNAARAEVLDARYCVTCHVEHRPGITHPMGVSLPRDFCFHCHQDIAEDRPSHAGMDFTTCASAGCHNFHDNRALYEDFLVRHAGQEFLHGPGTLPPLPPPPPGGGLTAADSDAPADKLGQAAILDDWTHSAHAQAGVNCGDCHGAAQAWVERPDHERCAGCHEPQARGFLSGKHGMRLAQGLEPMRPEWAHLPMRPEAHQRELGCTSCHGAHAFDLHQAAVESCLGCHADEHSRAFPDSPHFALLQAEREGAGAPGSGVSCATCHMPRERVRIDGQDRVLVQHNQNANLRPNEKMIRAVCMNCHGLAYAIDALADPELIRNNFRSPPTVHVDSIDMAVRRVRGTPLPSPTTNDNRQETRR